MINLFKWGSEFIFEVVFVFSLRLGRVGKKICEALSGVEDVVVVYVFGSSAMGKKHVFSDVDVAVLLKEPSLDRVMKVHSLLVERLGDRVDTLPLNFAPPFLRYIVVKSGVKVLSKDEEARVLFEARALSEGLDEAFLIMKVKEAINRRLKS